MRRVVSSATPLIAFARANRPDILHKLYGEITVPEAVLAEIEREPVRTHVRDASWIRVVPVGDSSERKMFSAKLHAGEVEVMILARELRADLLLMDDNAAKKTAKFLGFAVVGSFGILLKAKREGVITEVRGLMDSMIADGLYASPGFRQMVLEEAGEA